VSDPAAATLAAQVAGSAAAGLLSSFSHCLGMCGPLVASFGLAAAPGQGPARAALRQLPYHLGRVTTYALLGAVMGATGAFVNVAGRLAGLADLAAVLGGLLMVLLGLGAAGVSAALKRLEARARAGARAGAAAPRRRRRAPLPDRPGARRAPLRRLLDRLPRGGRLRRADGCVRRRPAVR
jgi:hypothetical protein